MSEETEESTPDRYVIESADGRLHVVDTIKRVTISIYLQDEYMAAWKRLAELNAQAAVGMADPTNEPLMAGVTSAEALAGFAKDAEALLRATQSPQEFLTQTLPAKAAEQRSGTLSRLLVEAWDVVEQSLSLLKQDAEILSRATKVIAKLEQELEQELAEVTPAPPRMAMEGPALSRPQPY